MIKNILKGFIIGIGKIIPGVSGALLAITLGVYDKALEAITHFFDNKKENFYLLLSLGTGIIISILTFSKIINYALLHYFFITMMFFIGLILGGIPPVVKKVKLKHCYIAVISFILITLLSLSNIDNNYVIKNNFFDYIMFFLAGLVEAVGTVVPGISSTALLMIFGVYSNVIEAISNLTNISYIIDNLRILMPFGIAVVFGLVIFSLLMNRLFKKHQDKTYAFILGITIGSIVLLVIKTFSVTFTFVDLLIGIVVLGFGIFLSTKLDR